MCLSEKVNAQRSDLLAKAGLDLSTVAEWEPELREQLVTALSTWALKEYVRLRRDGSEFQIVDPVATTATEAAVGATAILAAVRLEVFELAMWQGLGHI